MRSIPRQFQRFTESDTPMSQYPSIYHALGAGDPQTLAALGIPPRIAALAAAARKVRAAAPQVASAARGAASIAASAIAPAAAPLPSRAALAAEIHGVAINASRTRAGLQPLSVTELEHEFAEVDRLPASRTKISRRDAANMMARRQGVPTTQAGVDAMHAEIVSRLNATAPSPSSRMPVGAGRTSQSAGSNKPTQTTVDWGSIVTKLNAEAGLKVR
jgi:hypothetical protein